MSFAICSLLNYLNYFRLLDVVAAHSAILDQAVPCAQEHRFILKIKKNQISFQ